MNEKHQVTQSIEGRDAKGQPVKVELGYTEWTEDGLQSNRAPSHTVNGRYASPAEAEAAVKSIVGPYIEYWPV